MLTGLNFLSLFSCQGALRSPPAPEPRPGCAGGVHSTPAAPACQGRQKTGAPRLFGAHRLRSDAHCPAPGRRPPHPPAALHPELACQVVPEPPPSRAGPLHARLSTIYLCGEILVAARLGATGRYYMQFRRSVKGIASKSSKLVGPPFAALVGAIPADIFVLLIKTGCLHSLGQRSPMIGARPNLSRAAPKSNLIQGGLRCSAAASRYEDCNAGNQPGTAVVL